MKRKMFTLIISAIMISSTASSQTIRENIDKLAKDKATRDMADKADVLMQKKNISDSGTFHGANKKTVSKKAVSVNKKQSAKKYKKKIKRSSK